MMQRIVHGQRTLLQQGNTRFIYRQHTGQLIHIHLPLFGWRGQITSMKHMVHEIKNDLQRRGIGHMFYLPLIDHQFDYGHLLEDSFGFQYNMRFQIEIEGKMRDYLMFSHEFGAGQKPFIDPKDPQLIVHAPSLSDS